jgi:hypothetical protein
MATRARAFHLSPERAFYGGMGVLILVIVLVGFAPTWWLRSPDSARPPVSLLLHVHGLVFVGWLLLFIVQGGLISARRHDLHRRFGTWSIGFAVALVLLGLWIGMAQALRGVDAHGDRALSWLFVPLMSILVFAGLVAAGYWKRRDPQSHKRLMLAATVAMLDPAFGRMGLFPREGDLAWLNWWLMPTMLLALIPWDLRQRGRIHRATIIGLVALFGLTLLGRTFRYSEPWIETARLLVAPFR